MAPIPVDGFWSLFKTLLPFFVHNPAEVAVIEKYGDMLVAGYDNYEAGQPATVGPVTVTVGAEQLDISLTVKKH
jgi:hypothetical protein